MQILSFDKLSTKINQLQVGGTLPAKISLGIVMYHISK